MQTDNVVAEARAFALKMHGDQKYGSRPYGVHLKDVVANIGRWRGTPAQIAAGWLHDVLEDTMDPLHINDKRVVLRARFGGAIERIVFNCTGVSSHRGEAFTEQMEKLDGDDYSMLVKAADRLSNMTAVANDLEFETDKVNALRLIQIGHTYWSESTRFIATAKKTLEREDIVNELCDARDRMVFELKRHTKEHAVPGEDL